MPDLSMDKTAIPVVGAVAVAVVVAKQLSAGTREAKLLLLPQMKLSSTFSSLAS